MKRFIMALSLLIIPAISFAGPRPPDKPDHHNQPKRHAPPRGGHVDHHRDYRRGGLVFPVFFPAVVIVKETPRYRPKTILKEEIEVESSVSRTRAKNKWQEACQDWKDNVRDDYSRVEDISCGSMKCSFEGDGTVCYSKAEATVI